MVVESRTARFLRGESYVIDEQEVNRQNRLAIHYFATAGIPVGIANMIAQLTVRGAMSALSQHSVWLLTYFVILFLLERFVLPRECKRATLLAYLLEAPVFLVTILLGTVWDPNHQAMTFLMFMVVMPVFILDRPLRALAVLTGWSALFIALCVLVKDPGTLQGDLSHTLEFYLLAVTVNMVVIRLRFEVMESLERTRYHLEHDVLTGMRNRRSLETHLESYVGKALFIAMADVDHFTLINDFYGNDVGDRVLNSLSTAIINTFQEGNAYRYGGDDLLCIGAGDDEQHGLVRLARCRDAIQHAHVGIMYRPFTCAFGYVTGTPQNATDLRNMIQLATIYAHKAKRQGEGKTIGGTYNAEALRAGIVESNTANHARSYEINQLTGLPAMPYFVMRSEELLDHIAFLERRPVVGFLNIVHFKDYNDKFGYEQGDELIHHMAVLLQEAFPNRHLTYLSGCQFGVLCYMDEVESGITFLSGSLKSHKSGHPLVLRAGFAEYHKGDAVISLIDKARLAQKSLSITSKATYRMYDCELDQQVRMRQYVTNNLDQAIERGWLRVHYQPIVSAETGVTCNLEALSRWNDPVYGLLTPAQFVPTLENERIVYKLSLFVVRQIVHDLKRMAREGVRLVPVSVNLSRNDFFQCDMVEEISVLMDEAGLPHELLCIELTESAFVEEQELIKREVERFRDRGFAVWMDDFGSEYSTLNLLQHLSFDLVKIDMQFMRNFEPGSKNAIMVAAILDMCHALGITTLVEGVETNEQFELLGTMDPERLQGYLFSPPRPISDILAVAKARPQSL